MDLFDCPRWPGGLRLTATACAASFRKHRAADESPCFGCAIGAANAGEALPETGEPALCPWCGRRPAKTVRGLCVSCYNRLRECTIGRDRRGKAPRRVLFVYELEIASEDGNDHHRP